MSIEEIKKIISPIVLKYPLKYVGVFGSYAKNLQTADSDIDFLIQYTNPFSYFDLIKLEEELGNALGVSVDVVTEASLSPFIKDVVIRESQTILLEYFG